MSRLYCLILFNIVFHLYSNHLFANSSYYKDSSIYDIKSYTLDLKMSHENTIISGFVKITAKSSEEDLKLIFLELNPELSVGNIIINDQTCTFSRNSKWLRINLSKIIPKDSMFTCTIHYSGEVSTITSMGGFKSEYMTSALKYITYTLSEPFGSYLWFPCKQDLTDKADSVFINITTKTGVKVVSNGLLKNIKPGPTKNEVRYEWESHYPIAYYLIAVALAEYDEYHYYLKSENGQDSILFQNYYFNTSGSQETKSQIEQTGSIMQTFEKLLLPFPFKKEKYGHCIAPIGGGMENQTLTMVNSFSFGLIAHELAHSWFGDMVTCASWKDIWVNEGLTSYCEYLASEYLSQETAESWIKDAYFQALLEPEGTIVIPNYELENEKRIFNFRLTYRKGAYMVHQLRLKLDNDSMFFNILRTYLKKFAYANASVEDFKNVAENIYGQPLDLFFNTWFYGSGMPSINILWNSDHKNLYLNLKQHSSSQSTEVFDVSYKLKLFFENGKDSTVRINQQFTEENVSINTSGKVVRVEIPTESLGLVTSAFESNQLAYYLVKIYPNPAFDTLYVDFANNERKRQVEIYGLNGTLYGKFNADSRRNTLRINSLPNGVYLIKIVGNKKSMGLKFIKNARS